MMEKSFSSEAVLTSPEHVRPEQYPVLITQIIHSLHMHAFVIILVACYAIARTVTCQIYDLPHEVLLYTRGQLIINACCLIAFFCGHAIYIMIFVRPEHLTQYILTDLRENYVTPRRIMTGLPIMLLLPVFISTFTFFKSMIPVMNPFSWDPLFADLDAALHGGFQPWQLLQPVLGTPIVTSAINFFYNLWFFVMYGIMFWQAFSLRNLRLRMQFFLTFIGTWILLGNVAATLLSSVGPCYFGRITGLTDPFLPLMDYLRMAHETFPVWSLHIQEMLWEMYVNGSFGFGKGISAMPSLHVAIVFIFVLLGWRINRIFGIGFSIFAAVILIGSVHLGWHYAIDGYFAIVPTYLIWKAVGWLLKRNSARLEIPD
jgi:hypothetical protein